MYVMRQLVCVNVVLNSCAPSRWAGTKKHLFMTIQRIIFVIG